jgi:hypothetical protein
MSRDTGGSDIIAYSCSYISNGFLGYRFMFSSFAKWGGGGVQNGSTRHVGHFWPIVAAPGDCEDGEFGGMKIGRGNQSTRS